MHIHTYIHRYIQTLLAFNTLMWASLRLAPINELLKPLFKIKHGKVTLNQTLTLKLGVTLVLTVTQVYVFVNLRRKTYPPS